MKEDLRAITAALQLMTKPGYIVLGFHSTPMTLPMKPGNRAATFAGLPLPGYTLILEKPTTRADWTAQGKAIFGRGFKDPKKWERGAQFFRCKLALLESSKPTGKAERGTEQK